MSKKNKIDYELLIQNAVRKEIRELLLNVSKEGLPGKHYFYIEFMTNFPGVILSDQLRVDYPEDMLVSIQDEYYDLTVDQNSFSVTLVFDVNEERITIPFNSIIQFTDPSVDFGFEFEPSFDRFQTDELEQLLNEFDDNPKQISTDQDNVISFDFSKTRT